MTPDDKFINVIKKPLLNIIIEGNFFVISNVLGNVSKLLMISNAMGSFLSEFFLLGLNT